MGRAGAWTKHPDRVWRGSMKIACGARSCHLKREKIMWRKGNKDIVLYLYFIKGVDNIFILFEIYFVKILCAN